MCIALHKPAGVILDKATYQRCWDTNPDGAGFAYTSKNELVIVKGLMTFERFYEALQEHEFRALLIHFRIGTSGKMDQFNTHPWLITTSKHQYALIHNGILKWRTTAEMSDTGCFAHDLLTPVLEQDPDFVFKINGIEALEEEIGGFNKLVFMRNDGRVSIVNEHCGTRSGKVWYSNTGFRPSLMSTWTRREQDFHGDDYIDRMMADHYADMESRQVPVEKKVGPAVSTPPVILLPAVQQQQSVQREFSAPAFPQRVDGEDVSEGVVATFPITGSQRRQIADMGAELLRLRGEDPNDYTEEDLRRLCRDTYCEMVPSAASLEGPELDIEILKNATFFTL